ncbi:hypothetical protein T459_15328 [Capsicum annuum]|uniref:Uncharacterized protein n=1 Tax=Capsicum annuum TaxID=4072 RepID=A0A2G2ZK07_CAPAN|nr:hypothetical protein T459_15328 [Capsicum annuum]
MKKTMCYHLMQLFGSISQELDHFKEIPEEDRFDSGMGNSISISRHQTLDNGSASEICPEIKESAIRRETEGEFRLMERRE